MKVKCIKIYNEIKKQYQDSSPWLTIGKEYVVLSIEVRENIIYYLLVSDSNNQPGMHNAVQFEIISGKIPRNWIIEKGSSVIFTLGPEAWWGKNFWEKFHDVDPEALETYKREARIIYEEENAF